MGANVVPLNPADPRDERLQPALEALNDGGVVALPTETFYGLAADSFNSEAVGRVNRLKGKPPDSPVLLMLGEVEQVHAVCDRLPPLFPEFASRFWPGPLTLVVPASSAVPQAVHGGRGTVAVRLPGLALPRRLARSLGRPITGASANRTHEPPCRTAGDVARTFDEGIAVILDGGTTQGGLPSTILDLTGGEPKVLREGLVAPDSLVPYLNGQPPRRL